MKIIKTTLIITFAMLTACSNNNKSATIAQKVTVALNEDEGYKLLQQNCYACHSVTSKSHDEIIAPPLVAVKQRYLRSYTTENEFVEAITNWVLDPKEENALMFGAVKNFKVMPKQPYKKEDVVKIATYIFNNELEKPTWFQKHFNSKHPNGMGRMGRGNGHGRKGKYKS
jgi:hypothetical protein